MIVDQIRVIVTLIVYHGLKYRVIKSTNNYIIKIFTDDYYFLFIIELYHHSTHFIIYKHIY